MAMEVAMSHLGCKLDHKKNYPEVELLLRSHDTGAGSGRRGPNGCEVYGASDRDTERAANVAIVQGGFDPIKNRDLLLFI